MSVKIQKPKLLIVEGIDEQFCLEVRFTGSSCPHRHSGDTHRWEDPVNPESRNPGQ